MRCCRGCRRWSRSHSPLAPLLGDLIYARLNPGTATASIGALSPTAAGRREQRRSGAAASHSSADVAVTTGRRSVSSTPTVKLRTEWLEDHPRTNWDRVY